MNKSKRWARWVALVAGTVGVACVLALVCFHYLTMQRVGYLNLTGPAYAEVIAHLQQRGASSDLQPLLARLPKKYNVVAFVVSRSGPGAGPGTNPILVADGPELAGRPETDALKALVSGNSVTTISREVTGPDGQNYSLRAVMAGEPSYRYLAENVAGVVGTLSFVVAWLALVFWLFTDAQERMPRTAAAWGLLVLLTGPVGLGVYLVVRPAPAACPGCGKFTGSDNLFCPHCGHALQPTCPDCRRPTQYDWTYCGSCGTHLTD